MCTVYRRARMTLVPSRVAGATLLLVLLLGGDGPGAGGAGADREAAPGSDWSVNALLRSIRLDLPDIPQRILPNRSPSTFRLHDCVQRFSVGDSVCGATRMSPRHCRADISQRNWFDRKLLGRCEHHFVGPASWARAYRSNVKCICDGLHFGAALTSQTITFITE